MKISLVQTLLSGLLVISFQTSLHAGAPIQTSGDLLQLVLPVFALGATIGHRNENDGRLWDREGSVQFAKSAALTLASTYTLKYALDTPRPDGGRYGMPSGHTSISFSSAEFVRKRYGWEWGLPSYLAASWVAYSRVESRQHHPEDVVAGAGIGILSSYLFTRPYRGWEVSVTGDRRSVGLRFAREW
jgi:membrane-associated phospholipid phosphatase